MLIKYIIYGLIGWGIEIIWTGLGSLIARDYRLMSSTSIWMFFIYGMAVFLEPISDFIMGFPVVLRGGVYVLCIFGLEFLTGTLMMKMNICPWDYSNAKFNINGVIRLDYAPAWFFAGLLFEFVHLRLYERVKI